MRERDKNLPQQLRTRGGFEQGLLAVHREVQQRSHPVRKRHGAALGAQRLGYFSNTLHLNQRRELIDEVHNGSVERVDFRSRIGRRRKLPGPHHEERRGLLDLQQDASLHTLNHGV